MNFYFLASNSFLKSTLTIPKFQNSGKTQNDLNLFKADIYKNHWKVEYAECNEDDFFWTISSNKKNKNSVYFLATNEESKNIVFANTLCNLNSFTNTSPDYRANLEVINHFGAVSSYQSEFPFIMTQKLGSIYSDCGVLTAKNAKKVGVFLRSIYTKPIKEKASLYLYDNKSNKLLQTFKVSLNEMCYVDLTSFKDVLATSFIYAKDYLGIPIYLVDYEDEGLSFEHTHPPHESIYGENRFHLVNKLKDKANEKVS